MRVRVLGGRRLRVRLRLVVPRWGWHRYRPRVELHLTPGRLIVHGAGAPEVGPRDGGS